MDSSHANLKRVAGVRALALLISLLLALALMSCRAVLALWMTTSADSGGFSDRHGSFNGYD